MSTGRSQFRIACVFRDLFVLQDSTWRILRPDFMTVWSEGDQALFGH